jgi:hypothetical protein
MDIGNEEIAFVLILQLGPILERSEEISQVQRARGAHAG